MASGASSSTTTNDLPPPVLRSPSLFVQPPEDAQQSGGGGDNDDIIDLDLDRPLSRDSSASSLSHHNWNDIDHAFLSPDFVVSPRRPPSRMSESATAEGAAAAVAITPASPGGPFNFQTQAMSTSPVRSVRYHPTMQQKRMPNTNKIPQE